MMSSFKYLKDKITIGIKFKILIGLKMSQVQIINLLNNL